MNLLHLFLYFLLLGHLLDRCSFPLGKLFIVSFQSALLHHVRYEVVILEGREYFLGGFDGSTTFRWFRGVANEILGLEVRHLSLVFGPLLGHPEL